MIVNEFERHMKCVSIDPGYVRSDTDSREAAPVHRNPDDSYRFLRFERYADSGIHGTDSLLKRVLSASYYAVRPLLPVGFRKHLQRLFLRARGGMDFPAWPTDTSVERITSEILDELLSFFPDGIPFVWFWPEGKSSCLLLTHDVEEQAGLSFLPHMIDLESAFGLTASYELVPEERYGVDDRTLSLIRDSGNEICVHGLNHDGKLFSSEQTFLERAPRINMYLERFGARGFRSPVLYRNAEWFDAIAMDYDMSVPNSARYDPQTGGCCTVFPYFIGSIVELPLTMVQDYTLFHLLGRCDLDIWTAQMAEIREHSGLMTFNIHPDYVAHGQYYNLYVQLLLKIRKFIADENVWQPLPGEAARWWRDRDGMALKKTGDTWEVTGHGSERAVPAIVKRHAGRTVLEIIPGDVSAYTE